MYDARDFREIYHAADRNQKLAGRSKEFRNAAQKKSEGPVIQGELKLLFNGYEDLLKAAATLKIDTTDLVRLHDMLIQQGYSRQVGVTFDNAKAAVRQQIAEKRDRIPGFVQTGISYLTNRQRNKK